MTFDSLLPSPSFGKARAPARSVAKGDPAFAGRKQIPFAGGLFHSRSIGLTAFAPLSRAKSFSQLPKLLKFQDAKDPLPFWMTIMSTYGQCRMKAGKSLVRDYL